MTNGSDPVVYFVDGSFTTQISSSLLSEAYPFACVIVYGPSKVTAFGSAGILTTKFNPETDSQLFTVASLTDLSE